MSKDDFNPMVHPELLDPVEPVQLFDDYYFVGNKLVGFHILKTSEGLVLFDAMDDYDADDKFLIPGLKKLGLDQEKIVMLCLTHCHFDHYMGAEKVRQRTGCDIALSAEDALVMVSSPDNYLGIRDLRLPRITRLVRDGEDLTFGDHTVHAMLAPGHTPGCLNYSFEVHDHGAPHRIIMVGGFGVFGPGRFRGGCEYPHSPAYAAKQAFDFAGSCAKTWEYAKETNCDVYLNPHPHLCDLLQLAEKNQKREKDDPNALVIGLEGVRKWIEELFDKCVESALQYTDIKTSVAD